MPTPTIFEGINPRGTQTLIPCKDAKAQNGVIANTKLIKDTVGWSGKNELPYPYTDTGNKSDNGITFIDNGDGTITAKAGTATANVQYYIAGSSSEIIRSVEDIRGKLFSKGFTFDGPNLIIWYYDSSKNYISGQGATKDGSMFVIPNNAVYYSILIRVNGGTVLANDVIFKPMIRKADILDSTYEPYFGSTAFPRSEQAVLGAKNLADVSTTVPNSTASVVFLNNGFTVSGTSMPYISSLTSLTGLKVGKRYIASVDVTASDNSDARIAIRNSGGIVQYSEIIGNNTGHYELEFVYQDGYYFSVMANHSTAATASITVDNVMIRLASDPDSTYAPYVMTNKELTDEVSFLYDRRPTQFNYKNATVLPSVRPVKFPVNAGTNYLVFVRHYTSTTTSKVNMYYLATYDDSGNVGVEVLPLIYDNTLPLLTGIGKNANGYIELTFASSVYASAQMIELNQ